MDESTDDYTFVDLASVADRRRDQGSFHIFSEPQLRGEIFNLSPGDSLGQIQYEGAVLITGIAGNVKITLTGVIRSMGPLSQLLVNKGVTFSLVASDQASVQFVWSPPFEKIDLKGQ